MYNTKVKLSFMDAAFQQATKQAYIHDPKLVSK